jgi:hypothetical protein
LISSLFWTEEGQARNDERRKLLLEQREPRQRKPVWLLAHLLWWVWWLIGFVGLGLLVAGDVIHGRRSDWTLAGLVLWGAFMLIEMLNRRIEKRKREGGWQPIVGIDTLPVRRAGETRLAALWRWTWQPEAARPVEDR